MAFNIVTCNASSISGIQNFGDQLLQSMYSQWFKEIKSDVNLSHLSVGNFGEISSKTDKIISDSQRLVFVGGGYFGEGHYQGLNFLNQIARKQSWGIRNTRVYGSVWQCARRYNIPCDVVGVEVGPISNPIYSQTVRRILSSSETLVVRNEESKNFAEKICGTNINPEVYIDAALTLESSSFRNIYNSSRSMLLSKNEDCFKLGIHIHALGDSQYNKNCIEIINLIISHIPKHQTIKLYYLHDLTKGGQHPKRSILAQDMFCQYFKDTIVIPYQGWQETVEAIDAMDLILTTKLHVGIAARALGVPTLSIPHHPKTIRFYKAIGELKYCKNVLDFIDNGLPSEILDILNSDLLQIKKYVSNTCKQSAWANRQAVEKILTNYID
jgi:polysaccharide pyruvyl transferase WcaK-like protein